MLGKGNEDFNFLMQHVYISVNMTLKKEKCLDLQF